MVSGYMQHKNIYYGLWLYAAQKYILWSLVICSTKIYIMVSGYMQHKNIYYGLWLYAAQKFILWSLVIYSIKFIL